MKTFNNTNPHESLFEIFLVIIRIALNKLINDVLNPLLNKKNQCWFWLVTFVICFVVAWDKRIDVKYFFYNEYCDMVYRCVLVCIWYLNVFIFKQLSSECIIL